MPATETRKKKKGKKAAKKTAHQTAIEPSANGFQTEAARMELMAIAEANNGHVSPEKVVARAKDERSALHGFFEWDDEKAGEKLRLVQAGLLLRRIKITVFRQAPDDRGVDLEITRTRQFQSRPSQRSRQLGYEPIEDIVADEDKRAEMVAQAKAELRAIQKRYNELEELASVWQAIEQI
jgi:hypothetical protein